MHHAFSELWTAVGHDTKNEVLIFTATGDQWINDVDASSFKDVEQSDDDDQRFNVQIYDTLKVVENFVNDIEIPTICADQRPRHPLGDGDDERHHPLHARTSSCRTTTSS